MPYDGTHTISYIGMLYKHTCRIYKDQCRTKATSGVPRQRKHINTFTDIKRQTLREFF